MRRTVSEQAGASQSFEVEIPDDLPSALGDEERTWQLISNLISNAVKFGDADKPIAVRVWVQDGFLHVSVEDHGRGMSDEQRTRLFQKFGRIEQPDAVSA